MSNEKPWLFSVYSVYSRLYCPVIWGLKSTIVKNRKSELFSCGSDEHNALISINTIPTDCITLFSWNWVGCVSSEKMKDSHFYHLGHRLLISSYCRCLRFPRFSQEKLTKVGKEHHFHFPAKPNIPMEAPKVIWGFVWFLRSSFFLVFVPHLEGNPVKGNVWDVGALLRSNPF